MKPARQHTTAAAGRQKSHIFLGASAENYTSKTSKTVLGSAFIATLPHRSDLGNIFTFTGILDTVYKVLALLCLLENFTSYRSVASASSG